MAFWTLDKLREVVTNEEFTAIDTQGWRVTGILEIEHAPAGRERNGKTTATFGVKE